MIKNIIKFILKKLSRFIYLIYRIIDFTIPKELKSKSKLELKLESYQWQVLYLVLLNQVGKGKNLCLLMIHYQIC